jgi:surface antigen
MCEISDEMLMAYADGELAEDMQARVEAYIANTPDGRRRLAAFATTGRNLADIFDRPMREPVPQHLLDLVAGSQSERMRTTPTSNVTPMSLGRLRRAPPSTARTWALAASFATLLAAGVGSIWFLQGSPSNIDATYGLAISTDGKKTAGDALASALETAPSGSSAARTINGEIASIRPTFTFATVKSEYCRQYEVIREKTPELAGVACREAGGIWRIEAQMPTASRRATDGMIVPAGKETPAPVEAIVDAMISGDVLGMDDEVRLMTGGWRQTHPSGD